MIAAYLKVYPDPIIFGLPLSQAISDSFATVGEFIYNLVLVEGQDARSLVFPLAAIALRINISIMLLDPKNACFPEPERRVHLEGFKSQTDKDFVPNNDGLGLYDRELFLMLKPGHYDALYTYEQLNRFIIEEMIVCRCGKKTPVKEWQDRIKKEVNKYPNKDELKDIENLLNGYATTQECSELSLRCPDCKEFMCYPVNKFRSDFATEYQKVMDREEMQNDYSVNECQGAIWEGSLHIPEIKVKLACCGQIASSSIGQFIKYDPNTKKYNCPMGCNKEMNLFNALTLSKEIEKDIRESDYKNYCGSCWKKIVNEKELKCKERLHLKCSKCFNNLMICFFCVLFKHNH